MPILTLPLLPLILTLILITMTPTPDPDHLTPNWAAVCAGGSAEIMAAESFQGEVNDREAGLLYQPYINPMSTLYQPCINPVSTLWQ